MAQCGVHGEGRVEWSGVECEEELFPSYRAARSMSQFKPKTTPDNDQHTRTHSTGGEVTYTMCWLMCSDHFKGKNEKMKKKNDKRAGVYE